MRKITANLVLTENGFESNAIITTDKDGKITNIEHDVKNIDSISNLEHYNGVLIAGMVNCHSHIEYSYVKGLIPRGAGLPEFIRSIIEIKIKNEIADTKKSSDALAWDKKLYSDGVTAVADHNNNDYVYDVKKASQIYYHNLIELYDVDNQDADTTFHDGIKRMEESKSYNMSASVIPHACYTMEDRLIGLTGGSIESNQGQKSTGVFSTHFKESIELGGEDERERIIENTSAERSSIILVHCIYATEQDIQKAKDKFGDKLTLSPCPLSNIFIEKKTGDFEMYRKLGVRIALGTDSLSSNDLLSMVDEMKCVFKLFPNIPTKEIIEMATINGAKAIKIDSWAGSIAEGKTPGIVLLEGMDMANILFTDKTTSRRII